GVVHGGNIMAQNVSIFIECSEVRALIESYYRSIGQTWVPEPEAFVNEVPLAQIADWVKRLSHADVSQRTKAAQTLGSMGPEGTNAFSALFNALKDPEVIVRRSAADALEKVPPHADDAPMLIKVCKDSAEPVEFRQQAIKTLRRQRGHARAAVP